MQVKLILKNISGVEIDSIKWGYDYPDISGMPADLVWAACKIAALDFKEQDAGRIGLISKSVGGEVVESYIRELPVEVKSVLNHYRRIFL